MSLAQIFQKELVLGSTPIPGVIVFIASLLLLVWLAVIVIYLYRHYLRIALLAQNFGKKQPLSEMRIVKPMMHRQDLRHYLGKVDTLMLKAKGQSPKVYLDELYHLAREFIIELLGIGHTYSDDELVTILSGHARGLARLYWHILELRRHQPTITRERFDSLLGGLSSSISIHTKKKATAISKAKNYFMALKEMLYGKSELSPSEHKIETLLTHEKASFDSNLRSVKGACSKILDSYRALPQPERMIMYPELVDFYHKANDSLSLSLYGSRAMEELKFFPRELARLRDFKPSGESFSAKLSSYMFGSGPQQDELSKIKRAVKPFGKLPVPRPEVYAGDTEILQMQEKIRELSLKPKETVPMPEEPVPLPPVAVPVQKSSEAVQHISELMSKAVKIKRIGYITRIYELVEKSRKDLMRRRLNAAKASYESIKHNFVLLNEYEKKEVYPAITSLHNDLVKGVPPKVSRKLDLKPGLEEQERRLRSLISRNVSLP